MQLLVCSHFQQPQQTLLTLNTVPAPISMTADKQYQTTEAWSRHEFHGRSPVVAKLLDLRWWISRIAHFSKYTFFDQRIGPITPFEIVAIVLVFAIPIATATGSTAAIMIFLSVLVVLKTNALQITMGVSWERAILFHKAFGTVSLICGCLHGIPKIESQILNEDKVLSGLLLILLLGMQPILYIFIKPYFFEVFYYLHLAIYGAMVYFAILHGASFVLYSVIVFGVDLLIRYVLTARRVKVTAQCKAGGIVELCFDKPWNFHAGQYTFVMIPALGVYEWHPFSLSSAPHQNKAYLHIEVVGGWTQGLAKLAGPIGGAPVEINAFMEGPYGVPSVNMEDDTYKIVLLISGSIGVTPHQAMANTLLQEYEQGRPLKKIIYVWALKELKLSIINTMIDANLFPTVRSVSMPAAGGSATASTIRGAENTFDGPGVLCTELYCTSGAPKPTSQAVTPQDSCIDIPLKELEGGADVKKALKYGRPDIMDIFKRVKALALTQQEQRVTVSVCGPAPLVESVVAAARATTSAEVQFDIHIETFGM